MKGTIKSREKDDEDYIHYKLTVSQWIKGNKEESEIEINAYDNSEGLTTDINNFDYQVGDEYIFFLVWDKK